MINPESVTVLGSYAAPTSAVTNAPWAASWQPTGARLIAHFSGVETTAPRAEIRLNGSKAGLRLDLAKGELWLAMRGALSPAVKKITQNYYLPMTTAMAVAVFEEQAEQNRKAA